MLYNHIGSIFLGGILNRIIDANLNRTTEALRVLEEIARFNFNDELISLELKNMRHEICTFFDDKYDELLFSRDTQNDVGTDQVNITKKSRQNTTITTIFRSNFKRLEQALRVLEEYASLDSKFRYNAYIIEKKMNERLRMNIKKYLLKDKNLYLVTNSDNFNSDDEFLDAVALAVKSGVDIVQLREKNKPASKIIEYGRVIRQLTSEYGALFIVNDRVDLAQILIADGVHLGQDDIDIHSARKILGENMIIGISTHKPQDALEAMKNGADYIGVGPIYKTPTKPNREAAGLEYLKWAVQNVDIPFYAIGSVDLNTIDEVISFGAKRVALVRAIMNSQDIPGSVKIFKDKLIKNL